MATDSRYARHFSSQCGSLYPRECELCLPRLKFHDQAQFARHLRVVHATKEGGSYICHYGENNVCQKLPLEGVSDDDYETHIRRVHCVPLQQSKLAVHDPREKEFTLTRYVLPS
nr:Vacuolar protein sorting-associated protein 54 [Haemonchus contortus]